MTIEELRRLESQATPGPWHIDGAETDNIIALRNDKQQVLVINGKRRGDAAFIAALRNAAPALLRVAELAAAVADMWDPRGSDEMHELRSALAALEARHD